MASPSILVSEEQFQCSICLDVFTDPVSTPCGHNYCMACIGGYWDSNNLPQCPMCKETFETRPNLCVNKSFAEIVEQFKSSADLGANTPVRPSAPASSEVFCDICAEEKLKAVKSCLLCLTSYCDEHIGFHRFAKHVLFDPVNMEDRICRRHERLLEMFCQNDQMCVCKCCAEKDHGAHTTVPVERACAERMIRLGEIEKEIKQLIQARLKKVEEIKQTLELGQNGIKSTEQYFSAESALKSSTEREIEDCVQVFTSLVHMIERSQAEAIEMMKEKQKASEKQAMGYIEAQEQEITVLMKRIDELEQLTQTEDHVCVLQSFPSMCAVPPTKALSDVTVHADPCLGTVRRALSKLEEFIAEEEKRFSSKDLGRIQHYSADVTIDDNTVHPQLVLSMDRKQLGHGNVQHDRPKNPKRFDFIIASLGMQRLSSGRHYWEVEVGGKTEWNLGVAGESVTRKGYIVRSPENGFWTLWLSNGNEYSAFTDPPVHLPLNVKPTKVGIYLDYEEGCVSFYNVEAKLHIYTFNDCIFPENLYPYFNPGIREEDVNTNPLIICPVIPILK